MTFSWNVPRETAEPAIVVRDAAPLGDVARAALHLIDIVTELAADALGDEGPPQEDLRLEVDGDDLVLHVLNADGDWWDTVKAAQEKLTVLGITRVVWGEWAGREFAVPAKALVDGVDNPL